MLDIEKIERGCFLIIDKPQGMTSHDVVNIVRKCVGIERVGHSGTLDKNVSGVLIVGIGSATRLLEYLLLSAKEYRCVMKLHQHTTVEELGKSFGHFIGKIHQTPPVKSSVKRQEREREIYSIAPIEFDQYEKTVEFFTVVERGTYIRKLCHDIGEYIGVGAHMKALRRTAVGPFRITDKNLVDLSEFENLCWKLRHNLFKWNSRKKLDDILRPANELVEFIPAILANEEVSKKIQEGQKITKELCTGIKIPKGLPVGSIVRILSNDKHLIAMGTMDTPLSNMTDDSCLIKLNKVFPNGLY